MSQNNGKDRKNIAVLFGGRSVEHEISVITALELISAMDVVSYNPVPVYIAADGRWFSGEKLLDKAFYKKLPAALKEVDEVTLLPYPGLGGLSVIRESNAARTFSLSFAKTKVIPIEVYLLAFHGQYGEDGCIQGLLELADACYTSSDVLASALAMNKYHCKAVLKEHGIPSLPAALVYKFEARNNIQSVRERILKTPGLEKFPLFVKPCNLGSSIGVGRAHNEHLLSAALANVFKYDNVAIIEPCVTSLMEINVSVIDADEPIASVVEIPVASDGVLTYEDKYLRGGGKKGGNSQGMASLARIIDPKELDPEIKASVINYALKAFRILDCSGVVRFDFIIDTSTNNIYFNELNPLPGSMSYYLWEKSSPRLLYTEIINQIIERAIVRRGRKLSRKLDVGFKALHR